MKQLGIKTGDWFSWKANLGGMKVSHKIYWNKGYLYHMVYNENRVFYNRQVVNFEREAGNAYREWREANG